MRRSLGLAAALVLLASCAGSRPARPASPAPPPVVELGIREFGYRPSRTQVPSGRIVFRLANQGKLLHQPTLVALPEDHPPILEALRGATRRSVNTLVGNQGLRAGVTGAIAADLKPGQRYAFVCYAKNPDGQEHSKLEMAWEFTAGGTQPTPPPP